MYYTLLLQLSAITSQWPSAEYEAASIETVSCFHSYPSFYGHVYTLEPINGWSCRVSPSVCAVCHLVPGHFVPLCGVCSLHCRPCLSSQSFFLFWGPQFFFSCVFSDIHSVSPHDKCVRFIWVITIYLSNCNFRTRPQEPATLDPDNDDDIADDSDDMR